MGKEEGIQHNIIMTPDGLAVVPTIEEVLDSVLGPKDPSLTDQEIRG
jgi:hypothetical protein